jgi:hypothetical protein
MLVVKKGTLKAQPSATYGEIELTPIKAGYSMN